jgi:ATP-dependent DNA ligase
VNGEDLREMPLTMRKPTLSGCCGRPDGIFVNPIEIGEIGRALWPAACRMKLEGFFSKRADQLYRGGPSKDWIKVKNRTHPVRPQRRRATFRTC